VITATRGREDKRRGGRAGREDEGARTTRGGGFDLGQGRRRGSRRRWSSRRAKRLQEEGELGKYLGVTIVMEGEQQTQRKD